MGHQANRHQRSCLNQTNSPVCVHPLTRKGYAQFLSGTSSFTHCIASQTWRIISGFASGILVPHVLPRITHSHVFLHRCTLSSLFLVVPMPSYQLAFYHIPRGRDHRFQSLFQSYCHIIGIIMLLS